MALTQSQLIAAVADRAELSKADAKRALDALDEIVLEELGNAQKVRLGGLVQLTVRVKPATKKRAGRNPATGEEITSRPSRQASMCERVRWQRRRRRFRRSRRRGGGSRRRTAAPPGSATRRSVRKPVRARHRTRGVLDRHLRDAVVRLSNTWPAPFAATPLRRGARVLCLPS